MPRALNLGLFAIVLGLMPYLIATLLPIPIPTPKIQVFVPEQRAIPPPAVEAKLEQRIDIDRITAYNPTYRQTDADPHIASCGPNRPDMIAVSRDIFFDDAGRKHLCGAKVKVVVFMDDQPVVLERVVWDTMNSRYQRTVDLFLGDDIEGAWRFGVRQGRLRIPLSIENSI